MILEKPADPSIDMIRASPWPNGTSHFSKRRLPASSAIDVAKPWPLCEIYPDGENGAGADDADADLLGAGYGEQESLAVRAADGRNWSLPRGVQHALRPRVPRS